MKNYSGFIDIKFCFPLDLTQKSYFDFILSAPVSRNSSYFLISFHSHAGSFIHKFIDPENILKFVHT